MQTNHLVALPEVRTTTQKHFYDVENAVVGVQNHFYDVKNAVVGVQNHFYDVEKPL